MKYRKQKVWIKTVCCCHYGKTDRGYRNRDIQKGNGSVMTDHSEMKNSADVLKETDEERKRRLYEMDERLLALQEKADLIRTGIMNAWMMIENAEVLSEYMDTDWADDYEASNKADERADFPILSSGLLNQDSLYEEITDYYQLGIDLVQAGVDIIRAISPDTDIEKAVKEANQQDGAGIRADGSSEIVIATFEVSKNCVAFSHTKQSDLPLIKSASALEVDFFLSDPYHFSSMED